MSCDKYYFNNPVKEGETQLTCDEIWANPANHYGPNEFELFDETQKILHYTFIFQIFVFMQLFNIINARKINGEINVFSEFFNNLLFIFVIIIAFAVQMAMIEVGGMVVKCAALDTQQNLICLAFGSGSLLWGVILKFLPLNLF